MASSLENFILLHTLSVRQDGLSLSAFEQAQRQIEAFCTVAPPLEALQQRFLALLRTSEHASRKRDADGSLLEAEDCSDDQLVANLLDQVFTSFRQQAIGDIRAEESRYQSLRQQLMELRSRPPTLPNPREPPFENKLYRDPAKFDHQQIQPARPAVEDEGNLSSREVSSIEPTAKLPAARRGRPPRQPKVEHVESVEEGDAEELPRRSGRRRRDTLRSLDLDDLPASAIRPEAGDSNSSALQSRMTTPPVSLRPGHILATRNFARIAQPFLLSITSHRLASLFAKPLTEREAPGYDNLIYQPQDLKSIRAAVTNGTRALNSLLDDTEQETAQVWIPTHEDLVPPKGIVNAGQLEKELMRMFANAVIFNPEAAQNRGIGEAFYARRQTVIAQQGRLGIKQHAYEQDPASGNGWGVAVSGEKVELGASTPTSEDFINDVRQIIQDVQSEFEAWHQVERQETDSGTPMNLRGNRKINNESDYVESPNRLASVEKGDESEEDDASVGEGSRRSRRKRRRSPR